MNNVSQATGIPTTVLSGYLGAGKTTLLNRILSNREGLKVAVIVNDMSDVNIDASLIARGDAALSHTEETLVEMTNGCICCTLREDLLVEVSRIARAGRFDYLVIESSGVSEPLPVAQTFTFDGPDGESLRQLARIDTMVTLVDASTILQEFQSHHRLADRGQAVAQEDERTVAHLLIDQIEFADVVVVNKIDLVDQKTANQVHELIRSMNPSCRIIKTDHGNVALSDVMNTGRFDLESAESSEAWQEELEADHIPETEEYGISSFTIRERRPFHPDRLYDWLQKTVPGVVRAKGFFWIAPYPQLALFLSQAGAQKQIDMAGFWWSAVDSSQWPDEAELRDEIRVNFETPWEDRRQELVFIGMNIDESAVRADLDSCIMTDEELVGMTPDNIEDRCSHLPNPFAQYIVLPEEV